MLNTWCDIYIIFDVIINEIFCFIKKNQSIQTSNSVLFVNVSDMELLLN